MATKKKHSMDQKLVAAKQAHEVEYIHKKYKVPKGILKATMKEVGRSRAKIYASLREQGYEIPTRKR